MSGWQQIGGDRTWETHGLVLGKDDAEFGRVELVRVTPWLEFDREAVVTHGLYLVDEATFDYEDLHVSSPSVQGALHAAGMQRTEYEELGPAYKAMLLAEASGYEESRSANKLAEALPDAPERIEFWGGRESADKLEEYDQETRRAALDANFRTRLTFGRMPDKDALKFALGDDGFEMELGDEARLAFDYAVTVAEVSGDTSSPDTFAETVEALAEAPAPAELDPETVISSLRRTIDEWERRYGVPDDESNGIAAAAHTIASDMMSAIGFEWS